MNWSNYSAMKSAGNASFAKETKEEYGEEREYVALVQKSWNSSTGEANADSKREYSLAELESEKANYDSDMARLKAQSDGLKKAIADFKKV
jgi:hypothetical protein